MSTPTITPFLWFNDNAEEAAAFYKEVFREDRETKLRPKPEGVPGPTKTLGVEFEINGQRFYGLNGGPHFKFNEAVSFMVSCADQAEIDYFWEALTAGGGSPGRCGWLKDKFGLSWQVVPSNLGALMSGGKGGQALMGMNKIDIAALEAASGGNK